MSEAPQPVTRVLKVSVLVVYVVVDRPCRFSKTLNSVNGTRSSGAGVCKARRRLMTLIPYDVVVVTMVAVALVHLSGSSGVLGHVGKRFGPMIISGHGIFGGGGPGPGQTGSRGSPL